MRRPHNGILLPLFLLLLSYSKLLAQDPLQQLITAEYRHSTIFDILQSIQDEHQIYFYYEPDKVPYYRQSFVFESTPLIQVLKQLLKGSQLTFGRLRANAIIITRREKLNLEFANELVAKWATGEYQVPTLDEYQELYFYFGDSTHRSVEPVVLSGRLADRRSGEAIAGATLFDQGSGQGTLTDEQGRFSLSLPPEAYLFQIQFIGYQPLLLDLDLYESAELDLNMQLQSLNMLEVVVEARRADENVRSVEIGVETLDAKAMQRLSIFAGEADVMKSLEALPGVSSVGEGSSGLNVRGGTIDQNLILQNDALIFNSSHALGFFSIFNPDVVQSVSLYKGHIPAQYGGRLSSVLEVDLKDGNTNDFHGRGGIGITSGRLMLEGPIAKEKTSYLVSLRSSYSDWLIREVEAINVSESSIYFLDGLIKITHHLPKGKLSASAYGSYDYFRFAQEFGYSWNTRLYQLEWRQTPSGQLSSQTTLTYGSYQSALFDPEGQDGFELNTGLWYLKGKQAFSYIPGGAHEFGAGLEVIRYDNHPEVLTPKGQLSLIEPERVEKEQAREMALYISDNYTLSDRLTLSLGLRYALFQTMGPKTGFSYQEGRPLEPENVTESSEFGQGDIVQQYGGLEPRLSVRYILGPQRSLKLSYNRMQQFIHLISNATSAAPVDIWQVSNEFIPPQRAHNYSIGYFQNSKNNNWEHAVEVYYRSIRDMVAYKDLARLLLNDKIETALLAGRGRSYGFEISTHKKKGRWSGRMSYSFSRSIIQIESLFREETINRGEWFAANYDQPHQVSLHLSYQPSPRHIFNINFTYRSGRPITAPISTYPLDGTWVTHYSARNQFRIPAYHRLDVAYTLDNSRQKLKGWKGSWTISLYNLYARKNPFSVYFQRDEQNIQRAYKLSVLGTILPALTYNFEF